MEQQKDGSHRAGQWVRQSSGYHAFIPSRLPPDPPLRVEGRLQELAAEADRMLGQLDRAVGQVPEIGHYLEMFVRKEALLSSQIEGIQCTFGDLLLAEAGLLGPDHRVAAEEVINCIRATQYGLEKLGDLPLCTRLLRRIHRKLMQGIRGNYADPGELRKSQNWIGQAGSTLHTARFVPPPPHEVIPVMGELEKYLNTPSGMSPVIQAALAHAQFEIIHPFLDGNGRVGRILILLMLHERKALRHPVLVISSHLLEHQMAYYRYLSGIHEDGDWEGWIKYFLTAVVVACYRAIVIVRLVPMLRSAHTDLIMGEFGRGAAPGVRVLAEFYRRPLFTVAQIAEATGLTGNEVNHLVARIASYGIVREITNRKRHRVFCYDAYVDLFSDDPVETMGRVTAC
ncbi:MAG: Fic family protein [Bacteroidota bacterium]|nr:Fic family protein [Bacteroidota bacterium]